MKPSLALYSFFNSSAAYRVRIGLHYKKLTFDYKAVHLTKDGGEQYKSELLAVNPMGEVPTLVHNGKVLSQSMAILLYLDEQFPDPTLFTQDSFQKAQIVQFCEAINSGIHPIQNLKVRVELEKRYQVSVEERERWCAYWIERGFHSIEKMLQSTAGAYCFDDQITAADLFLIPQVYNARRYKMDLTAYPTIVRIEEHCLKQEAFKLAHPSAQPDFS
ncbi:MAG: maleylacetoacetate isomerase [Bdellovibrionales bacterium]